MRSNFPWAVCATLLLATVQPATAQRVVELPGKDRPLQGAPTDLWSVGAASGADWEQFSGITAMTFDAKDNLYLVDMGGYRVLQFDAGGKFVRQFGKQGGGPGEFNLPRGVAVGADGSVIVSDMMAGYEVFNADGSFRRSVPYPDGMRTVDQLTAHPQGGVVGRVTVTPGLGAGGRMDMDAMQQPMPVRIFQQPVMEGAPLTVLHEHQDPPPQIQQTGGTGNMRVMVRMGPAQDVFGPSFSWGVLPTGGVATLNGTVYAVELKDGAGRQVGTLTRPLEPRPVTDRLKALARDRERERLERGESTGPGIRVMASGSDGAMSFSGGGGGAELTKEQIQERVDGLTFAPVVPAARRLITDPFGRIWVERYATDLSTPGPVDVLAAEGRYIGTLTGFRLPSAISRTGMAAWVERDELDVERVVVRRLPASWR